MIDQRSIGPFELACGVVLPEVEVAFATAGRLAPDGANAVLVTHGYTSSPAMIESDPLAAEGSWSSLVGRGRAIDTDRHFVVCSNMLGSSFGTTGPKSTNPATGRPWGLDFPAITVGDIVGVQRRLLERLGVTHLRAVVGPSYGGWQALGWAIEHPDDVDAIGVVVSGLSAPAGLGAAGQRERLARSPEWHDGRYHEHGGMARTMRELRLRTLRSYGLDAYLAARIADPAQRAERLRSLCESWAESFDPASLIVLAGAAERFDATGLLDRVRARVYFAVCRTDLIFPPDARVEALIRGLSVPHRYEVVDSPYGHMASGLDWQRFEAGIRWLFD